MGNDLATDFCLEAPVTHADQSPMSDKTSERIMGKKSPFAGMFQKYVDNLT